MENFKDLFTESQPNKKQKDMINKVKSIVKKVTGLDWEFHDDYDADAETAISTGERVTGYDFGPVLVFDKIDKSYTYEDDSEDGYISQVIDNEKDFWKFVTKQLKNSKI